MPSKVRQSPALRMPPPLPAAPLPPQPSPAAPAAPTATAATPSNADAQKQTGLVLGANVLKAQLKFKKHIMTNDDGVPLDSLTELKEGGTHGNEMLRRQEHSILTRVEEQNKSALISTLSPRAKSASSARGCCGKGFNADVLLNPVGNFTKKWDVVMAALLITTAIMTPFEIAFLETKLDFLFFFNRLLDIGFMCDIVVQFNLAYYDSKGRLISSRRQVWTHYIAGWFALDIVSTVPYDLITFVTKSADCVEVVAGDCAAADPSENTAMLRMLKLVKLLKLMRILKSGRTFMRIMNALSLTNAMVDLIKYCVMVLVFMHWGACIWRMTPDLLGDPNTWLDSSLSPGALYIQCLEFALMSLVMGYGSVEPGNPGERCVAVLLMIICGSTYAYVIGGICGVIAASDPVTANFRQSLDLLTSFIKEHNLGDELKADMRQYFYFNRDVFRWRMYQEVTANLSPSLRAKAAQHTHKKYLTNIKFLNAPQQAEKDAFLQEIALHMDFAAFAPNDFICHFGQVSETLFVLKRGIARIGNNLISRPGKFFGHEMLIHGAVHQVNIVSVTYVGCLTLKRGLLLELLEHKSHVFPATDRLVRREKARLRLNQAVRKLGHCRILIAAESGTRMSNEQREECYLELLEKGKNPPQALTDPYPNINVDSLTCPEHAKNSIVHHAKHGRRKSVIKRELLHAAAVKVDNVWGKLLVGETLTFDEKNTMLNKLGTEQEEESDESEAEIEHHAESQSPPLKLTGKARWLKNGRLRGIRAPYHQHIEAQTEAYGDLHIAHGELHAAHAATHADIKKQDSKLTELDRKLVDVMRLLKKLVPE